MVVNPFSFSAVSASLRTLPGTVWRKLLILFAFHSVIVTTSESAVRSSLSQNIMPGPVEVVAWLLFAGFPTVFLYYIANRLVAAHDQKQEPTLAFLTAGLWKRHLLPFGLAWIALLTAFGLSMYTLIKVSSTLDIFWFLCALLVIIFICIGLRLFFLTPAIAYENTDFMSAIKRSWAESSGHFGSLFDVSLKMLLVAFTIYFAWIITILLVSLPFMLETASSQTGPSNIVLAFKWLEQLVKNMILIASVYLLNIGVYRLVRLNENTETTQQA